MLAQDRRAEARLAKLMPTWSLYGLYWRLGVVLPLERTPSRPMLVRTAYQAIEVQRRDLNRRLADSVGRSRLGWDELMGAWSEGLWKHGRC